MTKPKSDVSAPWHMWVLGIPLLLWNAFASFDYLMTVVRFEPYLTNYPEEALSYYFSAPLWMYAMWGISIVGGLIGTVLLLMRRRVAAPVFAIAWIGSVIAAGYSVVNPAPVGGSNLFTAAVIVIALLIVIYVYWLQRRGVLG